MPGVPRTIGFAAMGHMGRTNGKTHGFTPFPDTIQMNYNSPPHVRQSWRAANFQPAFFGNTGLLCPETNRRPSSAHHPVSFRTGLVRTPDFCYNSREAAILYDYKNMAQRRCAPAPQSREAAIICIHAICGLSMGWRQARPDAGLPTRLIAADVNRREEDCHA